MLLQLQHQLLVQDVNIRFLKEHGPNDRNRQSFSFNGPPETIRPYYFIDRYTNDIQTETN